MPEDEIRNANSVAFGRLLQVMRERMRLTKRGLAIGVGYGDHSRTVGKFPAAWEKGETEPTIDKYRKLRKLMAQCTSREEQDEFDRLYFAWSDPEPVVMQQAVPQSGVCPRLPHDPPFLDDLLAALNPPENKRAFARLFGAMIATVKMLEIVTQKDYGDLSPDDWKFPKLFETVRDSIERKGLIDFIHAEDLAAWSLGFFRNIAHRGLVFVLERSIFDWYEREKGPQEKEALHGMPLWVQLERLGKETTLSDEAKCMITDLLACLSPYWEQKKSIHTAMETLNNPRIFHKTLPITEVFNTLSTHFTGAECTALAYMLDTTAVYEEESYSTAHNKYFTLTVHALIWVAEFRRKLLNPALTEVF